MALVLSATLGFLISHRFLRTHIGLAWKDIITATQKSLALSFICLAGPVIVDATMSITAEHLWAPFLAAAFSFTAGWLIGVPLLKHPLNNELKKVFTKMGSLFPINL